MKSHENGRNIVGQQLPTYVTCCVRLHTLLHLVACCWELSHPFVNHCQHGRNNSQHGWPKNVGSCCFPFTRSLKRTKQRAQQADDVPLPRSGYCFCLGGNLLHPIRSTSQIWFVRRHQCGISAFVPQTSFRGETTYMYGVAKCRLFPQAIENVT